MTHNDVRSARIGAEAITAASSGSGPQRPRRCLTQVTTSIQPLRHLFPRNKRQPPAPGLFVLPPVPPVGRLFHTSPGRVRLVSAGLLLLGLRLVFVLRRPDLWHDGGDLARAFVYGAMFDACLAAFVAGLATVVERLRSRVAGNVAFGVLLLLLAGLSAVETEYFAFSRNRFDRTFVVYAQELGTLGGSVASEMSRGWMALQLGLAIVATLVSVWLLRGGGRRASARRAAALAGFAVCLGSLHATSPYHAQSWFGAMAWRSSVVELTQALSAPAARREGSGGAVDFAPLRRFSDPFGSKRFLSDALPLAHEGGAAPAGAFPAARPWNVVFLMMEGLQADALAAGGGTAGLTPALDGLAARHTFFTRFFANGAHTPRALEAALCGLAPRLVGAPVSRAQPTLPLACLPTQLRNAGWSTAFVHGGLGDFENRFEFLGHIGFRDTLFLEQFGANLPRSNGGWGTTDEETYRRALGWIDRREASRPFFLTVLSISNHHPFHVPDPSLELDHDEALLPRNTIRYADREAGRFIEALRQRGLLDSTVLFVFGDHGLTRSNLNDDVGEATVRQLLTRANVPLLVVAPQGLFPKGTIDRVASQNDLMPTVLDLTGLRGPHHGMGHSLGWTWADGGRDLPVFVHDLYSTLAARVGPQSIDVTSLDPAHPSGATGLWRWDRSGETLSVERVGRGSEEPVHPPLQPIVQAIDALYGGERWWSPTLTAGARGD